MAMNTVKILTLTLTVSGVCGQDTPSLKTILDPVFYTFAGLVVVGMTLVLVYINRKKIVRFYREKVKCCKPETKTKLSAHIHENSIALAEAADRPDVEPAPGANYELPVWGNTYDQLQKRPANDLIISLRENTYKPLQKTKSNPDHSYRQLHSRAPINRDPNNSEETTGGMLYETLQKQNMTNDHPYSDASEATVTMQIPKGKSPENAGVYQSLQKETGAQDHVYGEIENTNGLIDAVNVHGSKTSVKGETGKHKDKPYANLDVRQLRT